MGIFDLEVYIDKYKHAYYSIELLLLLLLLLLQYSTAVIVM